MDKTFIRLVTVALGVITDRLLTILSLLMTFGLALWIMANPDGWVRFATFAFFAVAVFLPCIYKERSNGKKLSVGGTSVQRDELRE